MTKCARARTREKEYTKKWSTPTGSFEIPDDSREIELGIRKEKPARSSRTEEETCERPTFPDGVARVGLRSIEPSATKGESERARERDERDTDDFMTIAGHNGAY